MHLSKHKMVGAVVSNQHRQLQSIAIATVTIEVDVDSSTIY